MAANQHLSPLSIENLSKCKLNDDGESDSEKKESLGQGWRALRKRRWIERRNGNYCLVKLARDCAFDNGKAERLNNRSLGVLSDRQNHAIVLLRRPFAVMTVMIIVAVMFAVGVSMSLVVSSLILTRSGKLLEEMVHPVRRGSGQKKPKSGGDAQI